MPGRAASSASRSNSWRVSSTGVPRTGAFGADRAADGDAVEAGQHDVEDDDVEAPAAREVEAAPPVGRFVHLEPREIEVEAKEVADGLFVFDDKDRSAPGAHAANRVYGSRY